MNWLDLIILVILAAGVVWGLKNSLMKAAFIILGILVGWWLAGQYSGAVAEMISSKISVRADTIITLIAYALINAVAIAVAELAGRIIIPLITIGTLGTAGLVDKLGGVALGLIVGVALSGVVIIGIARLTYDFEPLPDLGSGVAADQVASRLTPTVDDTRDSLEDALAGSNMVGIFLAVRGVLPGSALGFVPDDFQTALDILEEEKEKRG